MGAGQLDGGGGVPPLRPKPEAIASRYGRVELLAMGWVQLGAVGVRSRRKGLALYISRIAHAPIGARIVSFADATSSQQRRPFARAEARCPFLAGRSYGTASTAELCLSPLHARRSSSACDCSPAWPTRSSNIRRHAPDLLSPAAASVCRSPAPPCCRLGRPSFATVRQRRSWALCVRYPITLTLIRRPPDSRTAAPRPVPAMASRWIIRLFMGGALTINPGRSRI